MRKIIISLQTVTGPLASFLATSLLQPLQWAGMFGLVAGFSFIGKWGKKNPPPNHPTSYQ